MVERPRYAEREIMREGDVLLGKYRVERVTVESLVVTAEAVHLEMGNRASVLLLSPNAHDFASARERFVRSARILSRMQSKYVARVLDAGTLDSGAPFMVTQLLGMTSLAGLIREQGPLSATDTIDFIVQIAEALAEGHSHGIIHGSLKPSNVRLATGIDGWPVASLMGFGVMAQWTLGLVNTTSTRTREATHRASSLLYMSPEQIRHPMDQDPRSDIWSLGTIVHEALVGTSLYQGDNNAAILASIVADPPTPISAFRGDVPRQLEFVVLRCLEKDPAARYPSVAELVRALQPFASPETQDVIERIARVVARHGGSMAMRQRSPYAMVHVRSPESPNPGSVESHPPPLNRTNAARPPSEPHARPASTMRWGAVATALVGVGVLAGVGGALVTANLSNRRSPSEKLETTIHDPTPQIQVFAATPSVPTGTAPLGTPSTPVRTAAVTQTSNRTREVSQNPSPRPRPGKASVAMDSPPSPRLPVAIPPESVGKSVVAASQLFDDIK